MTGYQHMYYEKLALEVNAAASGLGVVRPALLRGKSGFDQKFGFVASDGDTMYAFDIYPQVSEKEVMRTYIKKMDSGAETYIVSLQGRPSAAVANLARGYGIEILGPGSVGDFFSSRITQKLKMFSSSQLI
jgi:hypothetical protein